MARRIRRANPRVLAVDPGYSQSAWLLLDGDTRCPIHFGKAGNEQVRAVLLDHRGRGDHLAVEMVASPGMAGLETFDTAFWSGRFIEAWGDGSSERIRREVVLKRVTGSGSRLNADSRVRQALIDRFGPEKATAVGVKAKPGPLYGIANDVWSALAIAVAVLEGDA